MSGSVTKYLSPSSPLSTIKPPDIIQYKLLIPDIFAVFARTGYRNLFIL